MKNGYHLKRVSHGLRRTKLAISRSPRKGKAYPLVTIGIPVVVDASWTWRKLLKLRNVIRPFIHYVIGSGASVFIWHDNWH